MSLLEVKNLTKVYGEKSTLVKALDDVSYLFPYSPIP